MSFLSVLGMVVWFDINLSDIESGWGMCYWDGLSCVMLKEGSFKSHVFAMDVC